MKKNTVLLMSVIGLLLFSVYPVNAQDKAEEGFRFDTIAMVNTTAVKSQYKSGTCWSYAATSYIETEILRIDGKEYDLSEMYFVNYAYRSKAISYVQLHGKANFSAGGQAHDVMDVIRKQGIATEKNYPGKITGYDKDIHFEMDAGLSGYLKAVVKKLDGALTQSWFTSFVALLDSYLGAPPEADVETKLEVDDYIELTSYTHHPYYTPFRLEVPDNWSFNSQYYNVPLDELIQIMKYALEHNHSVCWDGDVSSSGFNHGKALAILPETKVENMEGTEQSKWQTMTKKEMRKNMYSFKTPVPERNITPEMRQLEFETQKSTDDHLMHLTGLLKDQNGTQYFVTKNSWGLDNNTNQGYLNMSEAYMRLNTVAIMVHKDAIPKAILKKLKL